MYSPPRRSTSRYVPSRRRPSSGYVLDYDSSFSHASLPPSTLHRSPTDPYPYESNQHEHYRYESEGYQDEELEYEYYEDDDYQEDYYPSQYPQGQRSDSKRNSLAQCAATRQGQDYRNRDLLRDLATCVSTVITGESLAGPGWGRAHRNPDFSIVKDRRGVEWVQSSRGEIVRSPQYRRPWHVFLAYSTWTPLKGRKFDRSLNQLFAHWGLCFVSADDPHGSGPVRVYSMDFKDEFRDKLVVQTTWWTKEQGWTQAIYGDTDQVERSRRETSAILYFSEAELAVTAQVVLEQYLRYHYDSQTRNAIAKGARDMKKYFKKYNVDWNVRTGRLYDVLSRNCQDYATYLFENLLYHGWDESSRLYYRWHPEAWLENLPRLPLLSVPPSKKWDRIGKVMREATVSGVEIMVITSLMYKLLSLFE